MSWSRLKTIIIFILLLLNLFLLGLVGFIHLRSARYQAEALSEAASVLELNGIRVDRALLPASMDLSAATAARDTGREAELAAALLGSGVTANAAGGGLYVYESEGGSASFRGNGAFSVSFSQPGPAPADRTAWARDLLEGLGLEVWRVEESGDEVLAVQSLNGAPVFSAGQSSETVTFSFDGQGRLTAVSGRLLLGKVTEEPDAQEPVTVPTALIAVFNFIVDNGDICQAIREMLPVYRAAATDPVRLTPGWRVITDTGDYFLDAYTAEVTRVAAE